MLDDPTALNTSINLSCSGREIRYLVYRLDEHYAYLCEQPASPVRDEEMSLILTLMGRLVQPMCEAVVSEMQAHKDGQN